MKTLFLTIVTLSITILSAGSAEANWPSWIAGPDDDVNVRMHEKGNIIEGLLEKMSMPADYIDSPVKYHFTFSNELPTYDAEVEVFEEQYAKTLPYVPAQSILANVSNFIRLQNLPSLEANSVNFVSTNNDTETSIGINPGSIYMGSYKRNYEPYTCTPNCKKLTDADYTAIAEQYVQSMGVNTSGYGKPVVQKNASPYTAEEQVSSESIEPYFYDYGTVIYPRQLNGKNVYMYNSLNGLMLGIEHSKMVSSVTIPTSTLASKGTRKSSTLEDVSLYLNAPREHWMYDAKKGRKKDYVVTLGTPTIEYGTLNIYDEQYTAPLIVPSLVFPITNKDGLELYDNQVVVPLVDTKKLLNQDFPTAVPNSK